MKIALFGYGKMGKMIDEIVSMEKKHTIVSRTNSLNHKSPESEDLKDADVAIEFSSPESVLQNTRHCLELNIPLVIGTTGWYDRLSEVKDECIKKKVL